MYEGFIKMTKDLIDKYGGPATLVVTTTSPGTDEWNPAVDSEQSYTVQAAFINYAQRYINGTTVHAGDVKIFIAAQDLALVPNLQGRVERVINGVTEKWKIILCEPVNVNSQENIVYKIQGRL